MKALSLTIRVPFQFKLNFQQQVKNTFMLNFTPHFRDLHHVLLSVTPHVLLLLVQEFKYLEGFKF